MNIQQIKDRYSMREIVDRCGLRLNRHDYCTCPFHKKDDTPSLKVYEKSFYCFGCGKGGDIIRFVQLFHGLDFRAACEWISGEHLDNATRTQIAIEEIRRNEREKKLKTKQKELDKVHEEFSGLWQKCLETAPTSEEDPYPDEWVEAINKWNYLCCQQEIISNELGEL